MSMMPDELDDLRTENLSLRTRLRELKKKISELQRSAMMACENPPENCTCAGCLYAREQMEHCENK